MSKQYKAKVRTTDSIILKMITEWRLKIKMTIPQIRKKQIIKNNKDIFMIQGNIMKVHNGGIQKHRSSRSKVRLNL